MKEELQLTSAMHRPPQKISLDCSLIFDIICSIGDKRKSRTRTQSNFRSQKRDHGLELSFHAPFLACENKQSEKFI